MKNAVKRCATKLVDTFSLRRSPQRPIFVTKRISLFFFLFFFVSNDLSRLSAERMQRLYCFRSFISLIRRRFMLFSPSFNRSAYCTRTMAAVEHGFVSILRSEHASNLPSVVRRYKHALFSGGSVLTHIAAEKGNWFRTYRWHFRSTTFIAWRPPRVFLSPSECAASFFRHFHSPFSLPFQTLLRLFFSSSLLSSAATMSFVWVFLKVSGTLSMLLTH